MLARDRSRPFFLFLHTKAVHAVPADRSGDPRHPPYYAPEPHLSRYLTEAQSKLTWGDGDRPKAVEYLRDLNVAFASGAIDPRAYPAERSGALKALYDGAIHYMDAEIGAFIDELGPLGLRDDTVVIFTSDHGESFAEHHFVIHVEVYNDLLQVPLIIWLPALSGGRVIRTPVGLEDLAPTILALAGAPIPERIEGRVLPLRDAGDADRRFFAYYLFGGSQSFYNAFSVQEGDWKLIRQQVGGGKWESQVYQLADDPEEVRPVDGAASQHLQELLASWVGSRPERAPGIDLDRETVEHLRSLGYLPEARPGE
jgi:arylsulfatase A-like enzyme